MTCCGSKRTQFHPRSSRDAAAKNAPARGPVAAERESESSPEQEFAARHDPVSLQAAGNQAVQALFRKAAVGAASAIDSPASAARTTSEGSALDPTLRHEMEIRIGGDFSQVRIHTGEQAGASAQRLGALAYTVGNQIGFAPGRFAPETPEGRRLLAHELTHTIQQRRDPRPRMQRQQAPGSTVDVDLVPESQAEADRLRASGINLPTVGQNTWRAVGGSPYTQILPGYEQQGDTCGAASLVTALLIWDREHWSPSAPNQRAVDACDLILLDLERHGTAAAERWATGHPLAPCSGDHACDVRAWTAQRDNFIATLTRIRNAARVPGGKVEDPDYKQLGLSLYFLWNQGHGSGLGSPEIFQIQRSLGLNTTVSSNILSFDSIFTNGIVTALAPDEMAQVFWFVVPTGQQHAFIVGRLATGKWFLSDQGTHPAAHFEADSLADLYSAVTTAARMGTYWLFVGSTQDFLARTGQVTTGYTGIQKLASAGSTQQRVEQTIVPGTALGQVDAGYFTIGDDITSGAFTGREYSLAAAQSLLPTGPGGGVVVELPAGVFTVYSTSAVSDANLDQTSLDASDSSSMLLGGGRVFDHSWLILGNRFGVRRSWFLVY